jgi:hypothetical protein
MLLFPATGSIALRLFYDNARRMIAGRNGVQVLFPNDSTGNMLG